MAKVQVSSEGRVQGVVLQDGSEVRSKVVLSNASPQVTFLKLTPQVRPEGGGKLSTNMGGVGQGSQDCMRMGDVSARYLHWGKPSLPYPTGR